MIRRLALVLLGVVLVGCGRTTPPASTSTPDRLVVDGLAGEVTIQRNASGVPQVRATTGPDAWRALGVLHARDRLFQADLARRRAYGGLSEWYGPEWIELDAFVTALGLRDRARRLLPELSEPARRAISAYTQGFNAGVGSLRELPPAYRRLGVRPAPWTETDTLAAVWLGAMTDQPGLATELAALALRDALDTAALDALLRVDPRSPAVDLHWDATRHAEIGPFTAPFLAWRDAFVPHDAGATGSAFAIGPARTGSGAPLLAVDLHATPGLPPAYYPARIEAGGLQLAGATIPGAPGVVAGHNGRVAWGATSLSADQADLVILERHGAEGYVHEGAPKALRPVTVRVPLRRGEATRTVWWSDVGPILTELDAPYVVALRWAALEVDDRTLDALFAIQQAQGVSQAVAALDRPMVAARRWVLADARGAFGWQAAGAVVRRRGHSGRVPYPGSSPDHGWQGWLLRLPGDLRGPADAEPGFAVAANEGLEHPLADAIGTTWGPPWRAARLAGLLAERRDHTPDLAASYLADTRDLHAREVLPELLRGVPTGGPCRDLLADWDAGADPTSRAATVWSDLYGDLLVAGLSAQLAAGPPERGGLAGPASASDAGAPVDPDLVDAWLRAALPGRTPLDADPDRFLSDRAARVAEHLERCAEPPAPWGQARPLFHPAGAPHASPEGEPGASFGGTWNTVAMAGARPGAAAVAQGSAMRLVVPLDAPDTARFALTGSVASHATASQHADSLAAFGAGRTELLGGAASGGTLVLAPP